MSDPVALIGEISASLDKFKATNAETYAALQEANKATGADAKSAIEKADAAAKKLEGISAQISDLEQKLASDVKESGQPVETLGALLVKSDQYSQFVNGSLSKLRVEANTIIGQSGSPAENSDTLVAPQRLNGIIAGAYRSLRIRDVLPSGVITSNALDYTRETAFTNNAAETAEGAQKPESALTFELVTANVRTIAHTIKVSQQVLEDSTALRSYIDTRMRYGVDKRYDAQLVSGNGTGQNISGMLKSGNHTAFTPDTGDNALDSLNKMIEAVRTADYDPTAILLNPADWHAIERLKVGTSDDRYIIGNPASGMTPVLWGLPVVVSTAITAGKAIVGDLAMAYQVWNRMGTVVEIFNQNEDDVEKNLLTIRAEARGLLASYVPAAVQAGNLTV